MTISSSYTRVKSTLQACYAAPIGKILLGLTGLGVTAISTHHALQAEETTTKASHAALGALGILATLYLAKEFDRSHGEDLRELKSILAR